MLIHAEVSVYPMGTNTTSASFYIAKGIEAIQNLEGVRYQVTLWERCLKLKTLIKFLRPQKE